ncbi:MAG: hypothetical protein V7K69_13065 [Nostoc sp.]|uniref:hypothetical protein n=1 Tax=Nostoc sp. TaxID=1180 RepID=UPI002FFB441B
MLSTNGVLETDDVQDFYPTDNRKSFSVMIAGNKIITQLGKSVIQSQAIAMPTAGYAYALWPNSC